MECKRNLFLNHSEKFNRKFKKLLQNLGSERLGFFFSFFSFSSFPFPPFWKLLDCLKQENNMWLTFIDVFDWHCFFCCSVAKSCLTVYDSMDCSMPGFLVLPSLLEFAQTHVHWGNDAIKASHPLSLPSPPAFSLSQHQGLFQWVSSLHQVVLCIRSLSFSISPSNEYSGLISFRIDWINILASQRTLRSLLQYHNLKASNLWCSIFFMVQVSLCDYWENHNFDCKELWLA